MLQFLLIIFDEMKSFADRVEEFLLLHAKNQLKEGYYGCLLHIVYAMLDCLTTVCTCLTTTFSAR